MSIVAWVSDGRNTAPVVARPAELSHLSPPPDSVRPLLDAASADPFDATARVALGQWLNTYPEHIRPIHRTGSMPVWLYARSFSEMWSGAECLKRGLPSELSRYFAEHPLPPAPLKRGREWGKAALFDRDSFAVEWAGDVAGMERCARAFLDARVPVPMVMTMRPVPRVTLFTPVPVRGAGR